MQRALLNAGESFSFDCITSDDLTKFSDVTPCLYQSSYEKDMVYFSLAYMSVLYR